MSKVKQAQLFADSAMGVYIPQYFAETANRDGFKHVDQDQWSILESGPEHESYWYVWSEVLDNAETICGGILHQDCDLWIVWDQNAIDAINSLCESELDYETSHIDAGDNYSFMVAESWDEQRTLALFQSFNEEKRDHSVKEHFASDSYKPQWQVLGVDKRWQDIESDVIASMALDSFYMAAGAIYGPFDGGIILDSFPIGEIEFCLDQLDIDPLTMDLVRESCDAYITGTDLAYISTDSAWFAVLDVDTFNAQIEQHFQDKDDSQ
jgi:hypothetical protein